MADSHYDCIVIGTLALSDFYFGSDDWDYPLGLIQMCATSHADEIKAEALPAWLEWRPKMPFEEMARRSMDFWLQSEDLPHPENRVHYKDGQVHLDLPESDREAPRRLKRKLEDILNRAGHPHVMLERSLYLGQNIPLNGTAHQAGTARFGVDPATSLLNCPTHWPPASPTPRAPRMVPSPHRPAGDDRPGTLRP